MTRNEVSDYVLEKVSLCETAIATLMTKKFDTGACNCHPCNTAE